jgi:uncharacterized protein YjlB
MPSIGTSPRRTAAGPSNPETHRFADDGLIPNNPRLPLLVYRAAIDLIGTPDPEGTIEKAFRGNGWGDLWRNGIYPYVHYHSRIHESMAIARGRARVRFGGQHGMEIELVSGDVVVLPAGTGHQCVQANADLVVIGAYPKTGRYDLCRGSKEEHAQALQGIPDVPVPDTDPVLGKHGALPRLWHT